jgi:NAD(P)-dependent dehydrogenase (short-subunit alcohol dehydrogenase family)
MADAGAGRVAVVTGAARGIGAAIVARFLAGGMVVHALDIAFRGDMQGAGGPVRHGCDITDLAAVERVAQAVGPVDVLVNNAAAVTPAVPVTELDPRDWNLALAVNVTGLFHATRAFLPGLRAGGCIINLASTFGHVGSPGRVAYSTTKGAVLAFTRSLALDVARQGIRVNSVSPGAVATDRLVELFGSQEAADDHLAPLHPIGRTGRPDEIAAAVWFLASGDAAFMTGADLRVDGGYTAQ